MARNRENYNKWFRDYYKSHKKQYKDKAVEHKKKKVIWFNEKFKNILFCIECKENDRRCLDFHHNDPKTKLESLSHMIRTFSKKKIEEEVEKCIVLCSNCHRKRHIKI